MCPKNIFSTSFLKSKKFDIALFVKLLLDWYKKHKRSLPWRSTRDPYRIWLSEVILQQTRVVQGLPYYKRFIKTFPSVEDLGKASEEEVLHLWQGLGYYGRARRLHACGKYITHHLKGVFPTTYTDLIKLSGIGSYTAAAIASIAFEECMPVLDGNVYRVLARLFGLQVDMNSSNGKKIFYNVAKKLVPVDAPGIYNQALMEFGALCCTPRRPVCSTCPFQDFCYAYHARAQLLLPVKKRAIKIKIRYFYYIVIHFKTFFYLKKRFENDIWQGLYDFYLIEKKDGCLPFSKLGDNFLVALVKQCKLKVKKSTYMPIHKLTHQRLHVCFYHVYADANFMEKAHEHLKEIGMGAHEGIAKLPVPILVKYFYEKDSVFTTGF